MKRVARAAVASALIGAATFAAAPAEGVDWGPLRAYDSSILRAMGDGTFYNSGSTYAKGKFHYRDTYSDGDGAFGYVYYFWFGPSSSCDGPCWYQNGVDRTADINPGDGWVTTYEQQGLEPRGERARGKIHVCVDQSFEPDECSDNAYPTFNY